MRVEKLACSPCCAQEKGANAKIQHKCSQVFGSHTLKGSIKTLHGINMHMRAPDLMS